MAQFPEMSKKFSPKKSEVYLAYHLKNLRHIPLLGIMVKMFCLLGSVALQSV